uniref:Metalloendopeptidase n=1 Tax=Strigamia maritima TaxID=126957 RepID=T1IWV2_STRMM
MYLKFGIVDFVVFSMAFFVVNGGKSLWEVPDTNNVTESDYLVDDMWIYLGNYPAPKSALISASLWKDGRIPYKIDSKYFDFSKKLIKESMQDISSVSCIKFVEQTNERDFLYVKNLHNCASHIGFTGGSQTLALSVKLCMKKGLILHELMHALGFVHEHCRDDRDNYITINERNVADDQLHNFVEYETGLLNDWSEKYDFNSIMHYDAYAFAKDKSIPVIESLVEGGNLEIREVLSPADIRKLNKLYKC